MKYERHTYFYKVKITYYVLGILRLLYPIYINVICHWCFYLMIYKFLRKVEKCMPQSVHKKNKKPQINSRQHYKISSFIVPKKVKIYLRGIIFDVIIL